MAVEIARICAELAAALFQRVCEVARERLRTEAGIEVSPEQIDDTLMTWLRESDAADRWLDMIVAVATYETQAELRLVAAAFIDEAADQVVRRLAAH